MRDFYDLCEISNNEGFDWNVLREAFVATCKKRETIFSKDRIVNQITIITADGEMKNRWLKYKEKNYYAGELEWEYVLSIIKKMVVRVI